MLRRDMITKRTFLPGEKQLRQRSSTMSRDHLRLLLVMSGRPRHPYRRVPLIIETLFSGVLVLHKDPSLDLMTMSLRGFGLGKTR